MCLHEKFIILWPKLTTAVLFIFLQLVAISAEALKATNGVYTVVGTVICLQSALIIICVRKSLMVLLFYIMVVFVTSSFKTVFTYTQVCTRTLAPNGDIIAVVCTTGVESQWLSRGALHQSQLCSSTI